MCFPAGSSSPSKTSDILLSPQPVHCGPLGHAAQARHPRNSQEADTPVHSGGGGDEGQPGDAPSPAAASGEPACGFGQLSPSLLTRGKLKGSEPNKLRLLEGGMETYNKVIYFL